MAATKKPSSSSGAKKSTATTKTATKDVPHDSSTSSEQPRSSYQEPTSHGSHGIFDVLSLIGGVNPLALAGRAVDTATHVTAELVQALANFNDTMREINTVARRVNSLLDDVEQPIKIVVPQVTATLKRVDAVLGQVGSLPGDVAKAVSTLGDLASRLGPLAQFADVAGGMFGMRTPPK